MYSLKYPLPLLNPLKILCGIQLQWEPDNSWILDYLKIPNVLSLEVGTWMWSIVNLEGGVGIYVVFNAPENSKTERGGLNFVDPEKIIKLVFI